MTTQHVDIEIMHRYYRTEQAPFREMADGLLQQYSAACLPVRMVFFGAVADNEEYVARFAALKEAVAARFPAAQPLVSLVAQPVDTGGIVLEVHEVAVTEQDTVLYREQDGTPYILVEREGCKRLFLGGVTGDVLHQDLRRQSDEAFAQIGRVLEAERMPVSAIVRQWNYIEKITECDEGGHQHYQDFNEARSLFYGRGEWTNGYPAATGIGTQWGGVLIDMDVLLCRDGTVQVAGVDNPLQVAAHAYSQKVLAGQTGPERKTTPKFERAKAVWKGNHGWVYISGTAAIRGEQSLEGVGVEEQTSATLENIEYLVSAENLRRAGIPVTRDAELINVRVYVKRREDLGKARKVVEARYPCLPAIYTLTDVCRPELLVEIEGMGILG